MNRTQTKLLSVKDKVMISPNVIRLTLYGEELDHRTNWMPASYVKLLIPSESLQVTKPIVRTYTARYHDPIKRTITIDFAIHQPAGPATRWAMDAQKGSQIAIMGPRHLKIDPTLGDWYLFAADMSAMPAALSIMESLKPEAKGYAFLEVTDEGDKQELSIPAGIQVHWLIHPNPKVKSTNQLEAIKQLKSLRGTPNVFVSGELSTIREIRDYVDQEKTYDNAYKYVSSYWKIGLKEEEHKQAKKQELVGLASSVLTSN